MARAPTLAIAGDLLEMRQHRGSGALRNRLRDEHAAVEAAFSPPRSRRGHRDENVAGAYEIAQPPRKTPGDVATPALEREYGVAQRALVRREGDDRQRAQPGLRDAIVRQAAFAGAGAGSLAAAALRRKDEIDELLQLHAAAFTTNYAGVAVSGSFATIAPSSEARGST